MTDGRKPKVFDRELLRAVGRQITQHREKHSLIVSQVAKAGGMTSKAIVGLEMGTNTTLHSYYRLSIGFAVLGTPFVIDGNRAIQEAYAALGLPLEV